MRIKKNIEKTKVERFNVWDVTTTLSEIALVLFIIIAVLCYVFQSQLFTDIKIP